MAKANEGLLLVGAKQNDDCAFACRLLQKHLVEAFAGVAVTVADMNRGWRVN